MERRLVGIHVAGAHHYMNSIRTNKQQVIEERLIIVGENPLAGISGRARACRHTALHPMSSLACLLAAPELAIDPVLCAWHTC